MVVSGPMREIARDLRPKRIDLGCQTRADARGQAFFGSTWSQAVFPLVQMSPVSSQRSEYHTSAVVAATRSWSINLAALTRSAPTSAATTTTRSYSDPSRSQRHHCTALSTSDKCAIGLHLLKAVPMFWGRDLNACT